jgi:hypothetical protein
LILLLRYPDISWYNTHITCYLITIFLNSFIETGNFNSKKILDFLLSYNFAKITHYEIFFVFSFDSFYLYDIKNISSSIITKDCMEYIASSYKNKKITKGNVFTTINHEWYTQRYSRNNRKLMDLYIQRLKILNPNKLFYYIVLPTPVMGHEFDSSLNKGILDAFVATID